MSFSTRVGALALGAAAMALAGCGKTPVSPIDGGGAPSTGVEQAFVAATLTNTPGFTSDSLLDVMTSPSLFAAQQVRGGPAAMVRPRWWWRTITSVDRSFSYAFADTDSTGRPRECDVTVTRRLRGTFHFFTSLPGDSTMLDSANIVHKPIDDTWVRHFQLRRMQVVGLPATAWFVTGASAARVASNPATVEIVSLRLQSTGLDTTVADPGALWTLHSMVHVAPGDSLTLTATTSHTDDLVFCYWHDRRERFRNNGDGTYAYCLRLPPFEMPRGRFLGVNALSHGTLFDDALPYDSMAWLLHFVVGPGVPPGDHM